MDSPDPPDFHDFPDAAEMTALLKRNPTYAADELRRLARRNDPEAQLILGVLLVNGVGIGCNLDEAFRWFTISARARNAMAMNMVGRCHEYGYGTPVDYPRAAHWYRRAATFDCDWGIYNYAHLLANGRGVTQDRGAAFSWFKLAASRGHARAMHFLGQYYENGWEVPASRETAFAWYRRSAEGGDFRGQCSHASVLTEHGQIDQALDWLRAAVKTATASYLAALAAQLRASPHARLREFADGIVPDVV